MRHLAKGLRRSAHAVLAAMTLACAATMAGAQEPPAPTDTAQAPIRTTDDATTDAAIRERIARIYAQIEALADLQVSVTDGVATVQGEVPEQADADQARSIARRVEGVVALQDRIGTSVEVGERITPFVERLRVLFRQSVNAAPLVLLSLLVFLIIAGVAFWLGSKRRLWGRVSSNPFIGDLISQAIRVMGVLLGIVVALNLAGATALLAAILGGAGVAGIAIGFAVRDTLENYIASIMLSLRQPFRANDHIVIDAHEGKVIRLTSRATILMTLDGNHLRIPNATVYKAVILNYTRNPERRFEFELGVDANDDPMAAIGLGLTTMDAIDFVLKEPPPQGVIATVGDSNIVLTFYGWINQETADFRKARSLAISAVKQALEQGGFTLPEPIYRLRIDQFPKGSTVDIATAAEEPAPVAKPKAAPPTNEAVSVAPERHLDEKISEDRAASGEADLLDSKRPIE